MPRLCRVVLMVLLIALVPVRAMAALTLDACKGGEQPSGQPQHHAAPEAAHDDGKSGHDDASGAPDHCAGAAFGVTGEPVRFALAGTAECASFGARLAPGFCPDLIDRPPLVS